MSTLRELLKKPYWGSKDVMLATGVSRPTALKIITSARSLCKIGSMPTEYIVLNKYVFQHLCLDYDWLEKTGALDTELKKEKQK